MKITLELINNTDLMNTMKENMGKMYIKSSSEKIVDDVVESIKSKEIMQILG